MNTKLQISLHYALLFVLIHLSSKASVIAQSDISLTIAFLLTTFIFVYAKLGIDKIYLLFTLGYFCLTTFYLIDFGWLNITASIRTYLKITYAYFTIKIIGKKTLPYFEKTVFILTLISLPLFMVQLFFPNEVRELNGFLEPIIPTLVKTDRYTNSIIFTVNPWALNRNSGFMWEPGGFGAMLALAIGINLIVNRFKPIHFRLIVMAIAILTTVSTTAFINLLLLGILFLLNSSKKYWLVSVPLFLSIVFITYNLEFVSQKIDKQLAERNDNFELAHIYAYDLDNLVIGRFGSLIIDFNDFLNRPVFGYGLQSTERTTSPYIDLVRSNGLSDFLATFGLVGIVLLVVSLYKSFKSLGQDYPYKGAFVMVLIVLCLSFSNPVLFLPFFFVLPFYHVAIDKHQFQNSV